MEVCNIFLNNSNTFCKGLYICMFNITKKLSFWVKILHNVTHNKDLTRGPRWPLIAHLIFSSTGRRLASLCHCPLSVVRPSVRASVRALTFSLNIFFSETTYRILMKFHRNVPTMVLFRIS